MSAEPLALHDVGFRYEESDWRIADVSFALESGRMLAIIGPNGAGKSTVLKVAAGVLAPGAGEVTLDGRDLAQYDRAAVARRLGYLPQGISATFDYRVEEVVGMGRFPHLSGLGLLSRKDVAVVEQCMAQTETSAYRNRRLSHLSGGERQRVFLASVLAQEPAVLLLDEPTSALDIHHQAAFFRLLRRLAAEGIAVAVVVHDLNLASFYCDRLILLSNGGVARDGAPEDVIRSEILADAYGESVIVERDSRTGRPFVLPAGIESASRPEEDPA